MIQTGSLDSLTIHIGNERGDQTPPLTSWQDRPELTGPLRDLLEAQRSATESLPYKLLGVKQPELTQVYVQPTVRSQVVEHPPELDRKPAADAERAVTIDAALNRKGHLMITGEPGSGKSTIGYLYVQLISEFWLCEDGGRPPVGEPVLPLRIPARVLAENRAWADLLATGAEQTLGRLLRERPDPGAFARRALGARWLVFIDGLDEIVDPGTRGQVIEAIAHQVRRTADHRLVITTRPLPKVELKPLDLAGVDVYEIQPFGRVELEDFARAWFRAQTPITAKASAEAFVRQVRDGRLRELVRNPLLATIAAIAKTLEPDRPLPNNRVDLYGRFMEYLLEDSASRRETAAELRRSLHPHPQRQNLVEWVHRQRTGIVEMLAVHRLESESPLFEAARAWVAENHADLPAGWQDDLRALLTGTGVFTLIDDDIQFRHHSFAEFLAARRRAQEIAADFPELEEWIERGLSGSKRVFALFTFILWDRKEHDLGRVLSTLLEGTRGRVLLAGRLIAEGGAPGDTLTAATVERLADLLVSTGALEDPWNEVTGVSQVLLSLLPEVFPPTVLTRMRELRDRPEVAEAIRLECAVILGHLHDPEETADWLEAFIEDAGPKAIERALEAMKDLVPDGEERSERTLVRLAAAAGQDYSAALTAISLLVENEHHDSAAPLVKHLVRDLMADPAVADQAPLSLNSGASRTADLAGRKPTGWGALAKVACEAKCTEEALWAAEKIFGSGSSTVEEFGEAVIAVITAVGADGATTILREASTRSAEYVVEAAEKAKEHLQPGIALELAREVLVTPYVRPFTFYQAARVFIDCEATTQLLELTENLAHLATSHKVQLADALTNGENPSATAREFARSALADPLVNHWDFSKAVRTILVPEDEATAEEVFRAALTRGAEHQATAMAALCDAGHTDHGNRLIDVLISETTDPEVLADAMKALEDHKSEQSERLLNVVYERLPDCGGYRQHMIVEALEKHGWKRQAIDAARRAALAELNTSYWFDNFVRSWINAGGAAAGNDVVSLLLSRDTVARHRLEAAAELATAGLLEQAATLWLDIVRHHGDAIDLGIQAASRLVRCGRRNDVATVLADALATDRLTASQRRRLRALHAWSTA